MTSSVVQISGCQSGIRHNQAKFVAQLYAATGLDMGNYSYLVLRDGVLPMSVKRACYVSWVIRFTGGGAKIPGNAQAAFTAARAVQSFEPPSTRTVSPVIQRASSEARKATTDPISVGSPMRCSACIPRMKLRPASVLAKLDISVSITPGATALTRMPRGPSAEAKGFTSAS